MWLLVASPSAHSTPINWFLSVQPSIYTYRNTPRCGAWALAANSLRPGLAVMNFLEQGIYGRVGCAGLASLNHRQHERSIDLTLDIRQSELILAVLSVRPPCRWFIAASDAVEEVPQGGAGSFSWFGTMATIRCGRALWPTPLLHSLWSP